MRLVLEADHRTLYARAQMPGRPEREMRWPIDGGRGAVIVETDRPSLDLDMGPRGHLVEVQVDERLVHGDHDDFRRLCFHLAAMPARQRYRLEHGEDHPLDLFVDEMVRDIEVGLQRLEEWARGQR